MLKSGLLSGRTAVVTGAATGIGEAIARLFVEHGARVLLLDRDAEGNRRTAASLRDAGAQVLEVALDLRDRAAIEGAIQRTSNELGPIDVLINNAGVYPRQSFIGMSENQWDEMQEINVKSMFHTTQAVLPGMIERRRGNIVNISSVTFHLGMAELTHYVASKGAVIGLTRALAREVGIYDVHVNCVTPGAIEVEAEKLYVSAEQIQRFLDQQSLKRRILPIDIARTCLFLSCELSSGLTGQTLNVDGGWVMH